MFTIRWTARFCLCGFVAVICQCFPISRSFVNFTAYIDTWQKFREGLHRSLMARCLQTFGNIVLCSFGCSNNHVYTTRSNVVHTFVLNGEARHSKRGITTECQEEAVPTALDAFRGLTSLKTANQTTVGVLTLIDVQKVIAGLHVEAAQMKK